MHQARLNAKIALAMLYEDRCTVYEVQKIKDPTTHITSTQRVATLENQICRISYKTVKAVDKENSAAVAKQVIKLFVPPEVLIKPGSEIEVTRNGQIILYKASGEVATYQTHNEIILSLKEYA